MPLDVQKFNVKGCYRILEHATRYKDTGKDVNYSNPDIDKNRTQENYHVGIERNNIYGYLKDTVKKYDAITPPKRIKKDRVILTGFCFTVPAEIANTNKEQEYFKHCYNWLKKQFGEDNIITADVHRDEIHQYWDNQKNIWTESRAHMHAGVIPWTQQKGVNCKNFMNRDSMKHWHDDLDKYIYEHMGIHDLVYAESKTLGRNTDMLKKESIEAQAKIVKDLNKQVSQIKSQEGNLEQREQILLTWQDELQEREQSLADIEQNVNNREDELNRRIESADVEIKAQDARIQSAKQEADKQLHEQQKQAQKQLEALEQSTNEQIEKYKQDSKKRIEELKQKEQQQKIELESQNKELKSLNTKLQGENIAYENRNNVLITNNKNLKDINKNLQKDNAAYTKLKLEAIENKNKLESFLETAKKALPAVEDDFINLALIEADIKSIQNTLKKFPNLDDIER